MTPRSVTSPRQSGRESGATIVIVLILLTLVTLLALSLVFTTEVELGSTAAYRDRVTALSDTDNALNELLWRFNLNDGAAAPPAGSTIDVNTIVDYNAYLDYDPQGILSNGADDDGDGDVDEPDELNLARDWALRIMLRNNDEVPKGLAGDVFLIDGDIANGPPWGSKLVVPTIQPHKTWRDYSTANPGSEDVLTVRFKLDTDTAVGDSEGDGPEIVFYDPSLVMNTVDEVNTLTDLGGDGDPATGSPYNITWSDGVTTYPATGSPVLLVTVTARVERNGREVARRRVEAELVRTEQAVYPRAVCGCNDVRLGGVIDSYKSSEGAYGSGPIYDNGNLGSNGSIFLTGAGVVTGTTESGTTTTLAGVVLKDGWAGEAIWTTAEVLGTAYEWVVPAPQPCACDIYDIPEMMAAARADNDNATILPNGVNPYELGKGCKIGKGKIWKNPLELSIGTKGTVILTGGTYFLEKLIVSGEVQVGVDTDGDCVVDGPPTEPVRIFVEGDVDLRAQGIVNGGQLPGDLEIIVDSTAVSDKLSMSGKFTFRGSIYLPGNTCAVSGGAEIEGAVLCGSFKGGGDGVHYDEDLYASKVTDLGLKLIAWRMLD